MTIRKTGAIFLLSIFASSLFTGCGKTTAETDPTPVSVETSADFTLPSETLSQAVTDPDEPHSFEDVYGNQLKSYLNHQYYFDGEAIPLQESNFYFIKVFLELSGEANMGYYPVTPAGGLDLAAEVEFDNDNYDTYGDLFVKRAEESLELTLIKYARAVENGIVLSEDTKDAIDDMIDSIREESAAKAGMTLDEYLQLYFGDGYDEAVFRKILERFYIAEAYSKKYCEEYPFSENEIHAPGIRYALFYAPESSDSDTKDRAYQAAQNMKDACRSIADLKDLAQSAYESGIVSEQGDTVAMSSQLSGYSELRDWAFDEDRKTGEIDIIYEPEVGYYVIGFLGIQDQINYIPDIRYALFPVIDSETNSMTEAYAAAKDLKDACGSISDLTDLAEQAYENGQVIDYGDSLVTKDQLIELKALEDWAYDENRTEGEMDIVYVSGYGYFVVGYIRTEMEISDLLTNIALKDLNNSALAESKNGTHDFHTEDEYLPAPAAPTATPVPEIELPDDNTEETAVNPAATEPSAAPAGQTQQKSSMKTTDVLVVVFFTLAGVAIGAVIVVLIMLALKNSRKTADNTEEQQNEDPDSEETPEDDGGEEDEKS